MLGDGGFVGFVGCGFGFCEEREEFQEGGEEADGEGDRSACGYK